VDTTVCLSNIFPYILLLRLFVSSVTLHGAIVDYSNTELVDVVVHDDRDAAAGDSVDSAVTAAHAIAALVMMMKILLYLRSCVRMDGLQQHLVVHPEVVYSSSVVPLDVAFVVDGSIHSDNHLYWLVESMVVVMVAHGWKVMFVCRRYHGIGWIETSIVTRNWIYRS
jgi:hypothetical protein